MASEMFLDAIIGFFRSPIYRSPVMSFIDEHAVIFDTEEENKLEYTRIHKEFQELVDSLLSDFLADLGISEEEFVAACEESESDELSKFVLTHVLAVDNFVAFKKMMVLRNIELEMEALRHIKQIQAEQQHEEDDERNDNNASSPQKNLDTTQKTHADDSKLEANNRDDHEEHEVANTSLTPEEAEQLEKAIAESKDLFDSQQQTIASNFEKDLDEAIRASTKDYKDRVDQEQENFSADLAKALELSKLDAELATAEQARAEAEVEHALGLVEATSHSNVSDVSAQDELSRTGQNQASAATHEAPEEQAEESHSQRQGKAETGDAKEQTKVVDDEEATGIPKISHVLNQNDNHGEDSTDEPVALSTRALADAALATNAATKLPPLRHAPAHVPSPIQQSKKTMRVHDAERARLLHARAAELRAQQQDLLRRRQEELRRQRQEQEASARAQSEAERAEVLLRQKFLREQRDKLLAKRNEERAVQLEDYRNKAGTPTKKRTGDDAAPSKALRGALMRTAQRSLPF